MIPMPEWKIVVEPGRDDRNEGHRDFFWAVIAAGRPQVDGYENSPSQAFNKALLVIDGMRTLGIM